MGSSEPWSVGAGLGGPPRISLLSRDDSGITPQIAAARREVLRAFVALLVTRCADLWPQPGTVTPGPVERRTNLVPWPVCWERHPLFVSLLWFVKDWHDTLEDGVAAGGYREMADWFHFVRTEVVGMVRDISGRICRGGHVDASRTPAPQPEKTIVRPPLPGEGRRGGAPARSRSYRLEGSHGGTAVTGRRGVGTIARIAAVFTPRPHVLPGGKPSRNRRRASAYAGSRSRRAIHRVAAAA